jgi:hypothetical protein
MRSNTFRVPAALSAILLCGVMSMQPADAATVLLHETFDNVTGVGGATVRTVQDILTNSPGELLVGTTFSAPPGAEQAINVRAADNNLNGGVNGFDTAFFDSNFLALGLDANSSVTFGSPRLGQYFIDLPLAAIPGNANFLKISFDYALDGAIHSGSRQSFTARVDEINGFLAFETLFLGTNGFSGGALGGAYAHHEGIIDVSMLSFTPGQLTFVFIEGGPNLASNWVGGVDNLLVVASDTLDFSLPEPATLGLFASGLLTLGLAGRRRRR